MTVSHEQSDIADLVIDDIRERKKVGLSHYGTALKANNGRNALRDLYEELIDAAQYCRQRLVEEQQSALPALAAFPAEVVEIAKEVAEDYANRRVSILARAILDRAN